MGVPTKYPRLHPVSLWEPLEDRSTEACVRLEYPSSTLEYPPSTLGIPQVPAEHPKSPLNSKDTSTPSNAQTHTHSSAHINTHARRTSAQTFAHANTDGRTRIHADAHRRRRTHAHTHAGNHTRTHTQSVAHTSLCLRAKSRAAVYNRLAASALDASHNRTTERARHRPTTSSSHEDKIPAQCGSLGLYADLVRIDC